MRQNKTNKIVKIITSVLLGVFCSNLVFFNSLGSSNSVSALDYSSNTNVQFTFNPTLSVSVSDNLIIDELMPGTYSDSNIVDVSVSTNNVAGYSLSATVGTNSTNNRLVHTSDSNTYFSSLSSNISDLSSFSDNTWGYSYSTDSGSTWISGSVGSTSVGYNGLPQDTNTDAAQRGNGGITLINSTDPTDNQTIKFKIGAKAGSNQAAGTYTNTINFYAITKVPPISISDAFSSAGKEQYNGYYKMQDMTAGICNFVQTVNEDSITDLIDVRDGEVYKIAKLKDDNCWLLDNLRLNPTTANLDSDNTNAPAEAITNYLNGGNPYDTDGWTTVAVTDVTTNFWYPNKPQVNTAYKDDVATSYGNGGGKVGVYYNYCAITVGTYCYEDGKGVSNAEYDVCPINWRIPTGGASGEYANLYASYGDFSKAANALSITFSGYFGHSSRGGANEEQDFWTSTRYDGSNMYYARAVAPSDWTTGWRNTRKYGFSARCLVQNKIDSIDDLNYLQDFANLSSDELATVKSSMTEGTAYTLKDKRDGNNYTIKKINGEVWMTQNLRYLGDSGSSSGTMTIGNNNSNVENKSITLYSLNSSDTGNFNAYSGHCDSANGYNYACVYDSGNSTTGVWYNYAAATAGTITGGSNFTTATSDICPAGWHLPTGPNTTSGTDFNKLVGNTTSGWQDATSSLTAFDAVPGGYYYGGLFASPNLGHWWSTTAYDAANRYDARYYNIDEKFHGNDATPRSSYGLFVRCVMSN